MRLKLVSDVEAGKIGVESHPDTEVAMMLISVEETAEKLYNELGILCMRVPDDTPSVFVTSDHPVAHYDPTPKTPDAGVSYMSSPNSSTLVALDPRLAVLLVQGRPKSWADLEADRVMSTRRTC